MFLDVGDSSFDPEKDHHVAVNGVACLIRTLAQLRSFMMGSVLPGSVVNLVELWTLSECEANLCYEELLGMRKRGFILYFSEDQHNLVGTVRW